MNVLPDFLGIAKIATTHGNLYSGMTNGFEKCGANKAILLCGSVPGRVCLGPVVPYGFLLADVICLRLVTGVFLGFPMLVQDAKSIFRTERESDFGARMALLHIIIYICVYIYISIYL